MVRKMQYIYGSLSKTQFCPHPSVLSPPPPKKVERILCTDCKQKPGEPVFLYTGQRVQYTPGVLCSFTAALLRATPTPIIKLSYSDIR